MNTEITTPFKKNTLATVSMVLGIAAFVIIPFIGVIGVLCALSAIVCGFIALSQIKKTNEGGKKMAIAGIILGVLTFIWMVLLFVVLGPVIEQVINTVTQSLGQ